MPLKGHIGAMLAGLLRGVGAFRDARSAQLLARTQGKNPHETLDFYRTIQIDEHSTFYGQAGPKGAPTLLLLHGLPSSSRMFEPLFFRLSDRYHLVAPSFPGLGHNDWPDRKKIRVYLRSHCRDHQSLCRGARAVRYTLYIHDYDGSVGLERLQRSTLTGIIVN